MTLKFSTALRNAQMDLIESTAGGSAKINIYSGSAPASADAAETGSLLLQIQLPADYLSASASGTKSKLGSWTGTGLAAAGAGTSAGYFRVVNAAGTVCTVQGTVTTTGGGGDMTLDNTSIANGQVFTISTFTLTAGNA